MAEQFGEKSQEATPHRRQQARERGHVAKSQDLSSALQLIGGLIAVVVLGLPIVRFLSDLATRQLGGAAWLQADRQFAVTQWKSIVGELGRVSLPFLGLLLLFAVAVHGAQVGFRILPQRLTPDLNRINPAKGVQRIFSLSNAVRLVLGLLKILVVVGVAAWSLWGERNNILSLSSLEVNGVIVYLAHVTFWTCAKIAGVLLVLAILDYLYQRWKHEQDLRMTPHEVREEMKTLQGDPHVIARRRSVQRQLVLNRLQTAVPKADVVVTNPTQLAVAIQYDPLTMAAPIVIAKGAGVLAARIRQLALEHDIPILERKPLAQALYHQVDLNRPIPPDQYAAVAEVLRYVYELKGKTLPPLSEAG
jgi:flagellar biosynthetic protein FlhB